MTEALIDHLVRRIRERGPMPFAAYMQAALYHPQFGYYASGSKRTGWEGDFVTSPELDPAFGALWANGFEQVWRACGAPASFRVVEIGPGEGAFAEAVLEAISGEFAAALNYELVERSPEAEARQRARLQGWDRVSWSPSVTEVERHPAGCVFANEVIDNLPVHLVAMEEGRLREICVALASDDLAEVRLDPSSPELEAFLKRCEVTLDEGHVYEVQLAAESLVARAMSMQDAGATILVDYGETAEALAQRARGSLLCYSGSGVDEQPLEDPGRKDITVHANWTAIVRALESNGGAVGGPFAQREVLKALGLDRLVEELRGAHGAALQDRDGAGALRALSRRQAIGALADPGGLGGFEVVIGTRGIPLPGFAS